MTGLALVSPPVVPDDTNADLNRPPCTVRRPVVKIEGWGGGWCGWGEG